MNSFPPRQEPLPEEAEAFGHRFTWAHTGDQAFEQIERLIDSAQRSVQLEYYTVTPCASAHRIFESLRHAARRAAQVRVLLDAFGSSGLPYEWTQLLRDSGVEVRFFNPRPLLRWTFRNHRKLIVCDERTAFIGGFNIAAEYEGDGITRGWRDLGVMIEGAVCAELARGSNAMFAAADMKRAGVRTLARLLRQQRRNVDAPMSMITGPGTPRRQTRSTLVADLKAAQRVHAMFAYFVPTRRVRRLLAAIARRGAVRIIVPGHSDVPLSRWASQWLFPYFLKKGMTLFEYQPQMLHAKAMVIDDVVYLGSANLDTRSLELNFELVLRVPSALLAAQLRTRIDHDCQLSVPVARNWAERRGLWQRLIQAWSYLVVTRWDPFFARRGFRRLG